MDALLWAVPAALALLALAALAIRDPRTVRPLLSATACLWIATAVVIIARS
ncbi:MAG: hypothetical protein HOV92_09500 [Streptomyces sp.]|nr:hypothetical protein [Streptomyces sp.]